MKNTTIPQIAKLALGCSVLAISAGAVSAQEFALEEIVVTAQKREQSFQDVPISITAIGGEKLNNFSAGGEDIRLLSSRVPGLNAESSNGRVAPRFYLRGLGNTDFDLAASQPVSVIVDDVVKENVILKSFPIFDVERVEILRGPQGTLFGRNATGGAVNFFTNKPHNDFEASVDVGFDTYETLRVEGVYNTPLTDTLSLRLSGFLINQGQGFYENTTRNEDEGKTDKWALRGQLNWL